MKALIIKFYKLKNKEYLPALTSWLNLFVKTLGMLALIPLVNYYFPEIERFIWFSLVSSWSIIMLFDAGLNATTTRYFSYINATKNISHIIPFDIDIDRYKVFMILKLISKIYYFVTFLVILFVFPLIFISIYDKIIGSPQFIEYAITMVIVALISLVFLISNVFNGVNQGLGFLPQVQLIQCCVTLSSIVFASISIFSTKNLLITVISFYLPYFLYFFIIRRKAYQNIDKTFIINSEDQFLDFRQPLIKKILGDTFKSAIGIFASQGFILGSTMLINKYETIEMALSYMICMQFARASSSFAQVPFYSNIPLFCSNYANNKLDDLSTGMTKSFIISIIVFLLLFVLIGFISQTFFGRLLFGSELNLQLWLAFGLTFLVERIGSILIQVYTVSGKIVWHVVNTISGSMSFIIVLLNPYEINAYIVLLSIFISYLVFVIPYMAYLIIKDPKLKFFI